MSESNLLQKVVVSEIAAYYTYEVDPSIARVVRYEASDYKAHWDSGHPDTPAVIVHLWDGERLTWEKHPTDTEVLDRTGGRYRYFSGIVVNATPADLLAIEAYKAAHQYVETILKTASRAWMIEETVTKVKVVRGRKVPLTSKTGHVYEVVKHGIGGYGPFVNLRAANGHPDASHKYVALTNVEVIPEYDVVFNPDPTHGTVRDPIEWKFLNAMFASHFAERTDWLVWADYIEEHNHRPRSVPAGILPAAFAHALRLVVAQTPLVMDTYAIDKHNNIRNVGRY